MKNQTVEVENKEQRQGEQRVCCDQASLPVVIIYLCVPCHAMAEQMQEYLAEVYSAVLQEVYYIMKRTVI